MDGCLDIWEGTLVHPEEWTTHSVTGENNAGDQGKRGGTDPQQGDGTHPTVPKCPGGAGVRLKVFRLLLLLLVLGSPRWVSQKSTQPPPGGQSHMPQGPEAEL